MRLMIDGGDGDQAYFSAPLYLESIECDWFDPDTPRGRAILFRIDGGEHDGRYVALTSKVQVDLNDQFLERNWASVVVNIIKRVGDEYVPSLDNLDAVGMAFADVIEK